VEKRTTSIEVAAFVSDMRSIGIQVSVETSPSYLPRKLKEAMESLDGERMVAAIRELTSSVFETTKTLGRLASVLSKAAYKTGKPC
jgi:hypothetical protein